MAGSHVRYERDKGSGDLNFCFKYMDRTNQIGCHKGSMNFKHRQYTYIGDIYAYYRDHMDMGDCEDYWELVELQMFVCRWLFLNNCCMSMKDESVGYKMFYKHHDVFEYRGVPWWEEFIVKGLGEIGIPWFEHGVSYYGRFDDDNFLMENMYGHEQMVRMRDFIPLSKGLSFDVDGTQPLHRLSAGARSVLDEVWDVPVKELAI